MDYSEARYCRRRKSCIHKQPRHVGEQGVFAPLIIGISSFSTGWHITLFPNYRFRAGMAVTHALHREFGNNLMCHPVCLKNCPSQTAPDTWVYRASLHHVAEFLIGAGVIVGPFADFDWDRLFGRMRIMFPCRASFQALHSCCRRWKTSPHGSTWRPSPSLVSLIDPKWFGGIRCSHRYWDTLLVVKSKYFVILT